MKRLLIVLLAILLITVIMGCWNNEGVLEAKGLYYVTDYGAVGDGSHDDTAAFQSALYDVTRNGGTVLVPPVGAGHTGDATAILKSDAM